MAALTLPWLLLSILVFGLMTFSPQASALPAQSLVEAKIDSIMVPGPFRVGDEVEVVISFSKPSSCYEAAKDTVMLHGAENLIRVVQYLRLSASPDKFCTPVVRKEIQRIKIGRLKEGRYVVAAREDTRIRFLEILAEDELSLIPVDGFIVDANSYGPEPWTLTLTGKMEMGCMEAGAVDVVVEGQVVVVSPNVASHRPQQCSHIYTPYRMRVALPELTDGRYLVFVKRRNGADLLHTLQVGHLEGLQLNPIEQTLTIREPS